MIHMRGIQGHPAIDSLFQQFLLNTCYVPTPSKYSGESSEQDLIDPHEVLIPVKPKQENTLIHKNQEYIRL